MSLEDALKELRDQGWQVAVHNDYRLAGKSMTFWLFTNPNGRWIKGEGETDSVAVEICLKQIAEPPTDFEYGKLLDCHPCNRREGDGVHGHGCELPASHTGPCECPEALKRWLALKPRCEE